MLRFKRDDGTSYPEWEEKKIGDMGEIITGNTPSTQDLENYGDEFMFCSPADMGDNKYILKTTKMLSLKGFNVSRKLPKGSILVTCIGSTIGKIGIASKEMTSNQQINTIIPYNSFNNEFIYYALLKNFKKFLNVVSNQAVPILNKSQFEKLLILVPCLEEQQKIADFLSEVDNIIAMSEQEIESLEMQKKGAMQKIFSQEVRFKADDGSEYPEWEEKKIRDAIAAVVPEFDNNPSETKVVQQDGDKEIVIYTAKKGDEVSGYAIETYTKKGFGGEISLMVGFLSDGTIYRVETLSHNETPGLGNKIERSKSDFSVQFEGKNPEDFKLSVKKDGGDVDAITASTISSRAFCDAVERAYEVYKTISKNDSHE